MMRQATPGTAHIAFLHTARPNVELFGDLMARIDASVPVRHEVLETVLQAAVGTGTVTDMMRQQTEAALRALSNAGAALVVCTCSTIGGLAEATTLDNGSRVMRIDRPMAEAAVAGGRRILVAATLQSTVRPTIDLIQQVATETGRTVDVTELLCTDAWPHFQRGDHGAYAATIAATVIAAAGHDDVVVLAQASMAPAAAVLAARGVSAVASPELGVRAALDAYRRVVAAHPVPE
jgi:hypothetical protein